MRRSDRSNPLKAVPMPQGMLKAVMAFPPSKWKAVGVPHSVSHKKARWDKRHWRSKEERFPDPPGNIRPAYPAKAPAVPEGIFGDGDGQIFHVPQTLLKDPGKLPESRLPAFVNVLPCPAGKVPEKPRKEGKRKSRNQQIGAKPAEKQAAAEGFPAVGYEFQRSCPYGECLKSIKIFRYFPSL